MTYCLAIKTNDGLVFAADRRTSAGVDDVRSYTKLHRFELAADRVFCLMSAGNLATTQAVLNRLNKDLHNDKASESLLTVRHMYDAAEYLGRLIVDAQARVPGKSEEKGASLETTMIIGGQIAGEEPSLYLVYPLGNCITTGPEMPFLQIGESKYGKPILDRIIRPEVSLGDATRCALVSLESTMRSNISVGPPLDVVVYRRDSLTLDWQMQFDYSDPFYNQLQSEWTRQLEMAFHALPRFYWEQPEDVQRQEEMQLLQQQMQQLTAKDSQSPK
ncbi:MAG: peptidase [Nevskiales bacterium]